MKPKPDKGELFYANPQEKHLYTDCTDADWAARFGLNDK
jgi:hypothetical protein